MATNSVGISVKAVRANEKFLSKMTASFDPVLQSFISQFCIEAQDLREPEGQWGGQIHDGRLVVVTKRLRYNMSATIHADVITSLKFVQMFAHSHNLHELKVTNLLYGADTIGFMTDLQVDRHQEAPIQYFLEACTGTRIRSELVWNMRYVQRFAHRNDYQIDGIADPNRWLVVKGLNRLYVVCTAMFDVVHGGESLLPMRSTTCYKYGTKLIPRTGNRGLLPAPFCYLLAVVKKQFALCVEQGAVEHPKDFTDIDIRPFVEEKLQQRYKKDVANSAAEFLKASDKVPETLEAKAVATLMLALGEYPFTPYLIGEREPRDVDEWWLSSPLGKELRATLLAAQRNNRKELIEFERPGVFAWQDADENGGNNIKAHR